MSKSPVPTGPPWYDFRTLLDHVTSHLPAGTSVVCYNERPGLKEYTGLTVGRLMFCKDRFGDLMVSQNGSLWTNPSYGQVAEAVGILSRTESKGE